MPPRRLPLRQAQQQAVNIGSIPDGLLAQCLKLIPQSERVQNVSLVCKRFHGVCSTPELLHRLDVDIAGERALPRTQALLRWLVGRAQHLHTLHITVEPPSSHGEAEKQELSATVCSILAALSYGGQLEVLEAGVLPALPTLAWLPALRQLKTLVLDRKNKSNQVLVIPPIQGMTALQRLELGGTVQYGNLDTAARLPPSLTHLFLNDPVTLSMPHQIVLLPKLQSLELQCGSYDRASVDPLTQMHSLTRLVLWDTRPPDSFAQLTRLQHLELGGETMSHVSTAQLDAGLSCMQQLTCLILNSEVSFLPELPPALASLTRLQRCMLWLPLPAEENEEGGGMLEQRRLPSGPWLHNLRYLCTHWGILANSAAELANTTQLEHICIGDLPDLNADVDGEQDRWDAFWERASVHSPLRRLSFFVDDDSCPMCLVHMILRLQRRRPALSVYFDGNDGHPTFCDEADAE